MCQPWQISIWWQLWKLSGIAFLVALSLRNSWSKSWCLSRKPWGIVVGAVAAVNLLQTARGKAFPTAPGECTAWAQRPDVGLKHILLKKKQSTTGKKLNASVWRIIQQLGPESPQGEVSSFQQTFPRFYCQKSFPFRHQPSSECQSCATKGQSSIGRWFFLKMRKCQTNPMLQWFLWPAQSKSISNTLTMLVCAWSGCFLQGNWCKASCNLEKKIAVATFPPEIVEIATELPNSSLSPSKRV